jgi:hypothetical protein
LVAKWCETAQEPMQLCDAWLNLPDLTGLRQARTLTKLYNARPTWLDNAHRKLDSAVLAAYGWPADPSTSSGPGLSDEEILARLLTLNRARAPSVP